MAIQKFKTIFQLKRGLSSSWKEKNPVLANGEPGFEIDTGNLKIGNGVDTWDQLPYLADMSIPTKMNKIKPYLYEIYYDNIDYKYADSYYFEPTDGYCSAVRKGQFYGRNFDWTYDNNATFIVHTPHKNGRCATVGTTGTVKDLTEEIASSGKYHDSYKILPFKVVDGINEFGVIANSNVVPTDKGSNLYTIPNIAEKNKVNQLSLIRYILDNFKSAREAVEYIADYVNVVANDSLGKKHYELHYMIADKSDTFLLEIINHQVIIIDMGENSNSTLANKPYMTNFYLSDIAFNPDGKVYTPFTQEGNNNAITYNHITPNGCGLERYNLIVDGYGEMQLRELMNQLIYSNAYKASEQTLAQHWYTEFVELPDPEDPSKTLNVATPYEHFAQTLAQGEQEYIHRSRDAENVWQTTHSAIYDINNKTFKIITQEDGIEYSFALEDVFYVKETLVGDEAQVSLDNYGFTFIIPRAKSPEFSIGEVTTGEEMDVNLRQIGIEENPSYAFDFILKTGLSGIEAAAHTVSPDKEASVEVDEYPQGHYHFTFWIPKGDPIDLKTGYVSTRPYDWGATANVRKEEIHGIPYYYLDLGIPYGPRGASSLFDLKYVGKYIVGYTALKVQPSDWLTNWINYYENAGTDIDPEYIKLTSAQPPAFQANKYYKKQSSAQYLIPSFPDNITYKKLIILFNCKPGVADSPLYITDWSGQHGIAHINNGIINGQESYTCCELEHDGYFITATSYKRSSGTSQVAYKNKIKISETDIESNGISQLNITRYSGDQPDIPNDSEIFIYGITEKDNE